MTRIAFYNQITSITTRLIALSLCNEQNFPTMRATGGDEHLISIAHTANLSTALKNVSYEEIYEELEQARGYNFRFIDGALVQLFYAFRNDRVIKHHLAFFPSPDLSPYQNDPAIYEDEEIFADVVRRNVVAFPVRFDFDEDAPENEPVNHPVSHLTLGQYENCRIPVSAPLDPQMFITFLLRHFYNKFFRSNVAQLVFPAIDVALCIHDSELKTPHLCLVRH